MNQAYPEFSVLVVPMGVANPSGRSWDWSHTYTIDGVDFGDSMGGTWRIWMEGNTGFQSSEHMDTSITRLRTIVTRAAICKVKLADGGNPI